VTRTNPPEIRRFESCIWEHGWGWFIGLDATDTINDTFLENAMKRRTDRLVLVLMICAAGLAGCTGKQDALVSATDTVVNKTLGPYLQWSIENDAQMAPETKAAMLRELWSAKSYVAEAKGEPQPAMPLPPAAVPAWRRGR
jgi:hypothetical protein